MIARSGTTAFGARVVSLGLLRVQAHINISHLDVYLDKEHDFVVADRMSCLGTKVPLRISSWTAVCRRKSMRRLFEVFNDVNLDGDGSISLMEFRKHMAITRPELQPMAASIFNSIDNVRYKCRATLASL
jgi:hypothetical protein